MSTLHLATLLLRHVHGHPDGHVSAVLGGHVDTAPRGRHVRNLRGDTVTLNLGKSEPRTSRHFSRATERHLCLGTRRGRCTATACRHVLLSPRVSAHEGSYEVSSSCNVTVNCMPCLAKYTLYEDWIHSKKV